MIKQQFRWARGSQYNTLRMLPWMLAHAPLLAFFFVCDIALPFLWACSAAAWAIRSLGHRHDTDLYAGLLHVRSNSLLVIVMLTVLTSTLAMCLRQARHVGEVPVDFFWMPAYVLFSTIVLMPIRLYGFVRCGHVGGWGTRANAFVANAQDLPSEDALPVASGAAGALATTTKARTETKTTDAPGGDPRALVPYLIAAAAIALGVLYDIRPV